MKLNDIGEFGFIKRITPDTIYDDRNVLRAIVTMQRIYCESQRCIVLTTDLLVERIHFIKESIAGYDGI
jgi:thiamine-monophosphate kinase